MAKELDAADPRCTRDFSCNEWPSLAGLLYPHDDAMALYRTRPSFLVYCTSPYSAVTVALAAKGQDQHFLNDGRESIVYDRGDAVSSSAVDKASILLQGNIYVLSDNS